MLKSATAQDLRLAAPSNSRSRQVPVPKTAWAHDSDSSGDDDPSKSARQQSRTQLLGSVLRSLSTTCTADSQSAVQTAGPCALIPPTEHRPGQAYTEYARTQRPLSSRSFQKLQSIVQRLAVDRGLHLKHTQVQETVTSAPCGRR